MLQRKGQILTEEVKTEVKQGRLSKIITKAFTRTTISLSMLVVGLVIVVILSIAQFGFDWNNFDFGKWLSNSLLLTGILIVFMVIGESFKNTIMERPNGKYQVSLKKYRSIRNSIDDIVPYFSDYHIDYREKKLKDKKIALITNAGISQARDIVENLKLSQIEILDHQPLEVHGIEFFTITKEQKNIILNVLQHTKIGITTPIYYLSEYSTYDVLTDQDLPDKIEKKKKYFRWGGRLVRVVMGLSISFLFAALTTNDFMNAGDWQSWYNLFSRIFTAISGLGTGYMIAYGINGFEIEDLETKSTFLTVFKEAIRLKTWIPMSHHEKFVKQMEEFKKEEEKRKAEQQVLTKEEFEEYQRLKESQPVQIEHKEPIKV